MSASTQTGDAPKINPPPVNGHAKKAKTARKVKAKTTARAAIPAAALQQASASNQVKGVPTIVQPIPFPATALANSWMSGLRAREAELIAEQSATAIRLAEVRKIIAGSARTAKAPKVKAKRRAKKAPAKMAA